MPLGEVYSSAFSGSMSSAMQAQSSSGAAAAADSGTTHPEVSINRTGTFSASSCSAATARSATAMGRSPSDSATTRTQPVAAPAASCISGLTPGVRRRFASSVSEVPATYSKRVPVRRAMACNKARVTLTRR